MIGLLIAVGLGYAGKWRWLGLTYLLDFLVVGTVGIVRGSGDAGLLLIPLIPLVEVPLGYAIGVVWHRWKTGAWPRDKAIAGLAPVTRGTDEAGEPVLTWEIETPMLTPQVARVFAVVVVALFIVMSGVFGLIGRGDAMRGVEIAGIGSAGVTILLLLVVFGLFFNRLRRRYVLSRTGYSTAITDPRMAAGIAAAGTAGATTEDAVVAGSAIGGAASMREARNWDTVVAAMPDPARHCIRLQLRGLGWLGVDTVFCHAEGFDAVETWIAGRIDRGPAAP